MTSKHLSDGNNFSVINLKNEPLGLNTQESLADLKDKEIAIYTENMINKFE